MNISFLFIQLHGNKKELFIIIKGICMVGGNITSIFPHFIPSPYY